MAMRAKERNKAEKRDREHVRTCTILSRVAREGLMEIPGLRHEPCRWKDI